MSFLKSQEINDTHLVAKAPSKTSEARVLCEHEYQGADLDDSLAARLEQRADGAKVGRQILMPHRLYHLAADHLPMQQTNRINSMNFRSRQHNTHCTSPATLRQTVEDGCHEEGKTMQSCMPLVK